MKLRSTTDPAHLIWIWIQNSFLPIQPLPFLALYREPDPLVDRVRHWCLLCAASRLFSQDIDLRQWPAGDSTKISPSLLYISVFTRKGTYLKPMFVLHLNSVIQHRVASRSPKLVIRKAGVTANPKPQTLKPQNPKPNPRISALNPKPNPSNIA